MYTALSYQGIPRKPFIAATLPQTDRQTDRHLAKHSKPLLCHQRCLQDHHFVMMQPTYTHKDTLRPTTRKHYQLILSQPVKTQVHTHTRKRNICSFMCHSTINECVIFSSVLPADRRQGEKFCH